jgi:predicted amidohydrolase
VTQVALVAVQLEIGQDVLSSPEAYRAHIESSLDRALAAAAERSGASDLTSALQAAGSHRIIVFPEIAGHLALYALAPPAARKAKTLGSALAAAAVRRPLEVLRGVASTRLLDPKHAVLAALAPDGERFWKSVFAPLARKHAAYIVAGSYLRLAPDGELHNASLLFGPEGRLLATTDKVNLVPGIEDGAKAGLALARGDANIPIVDTPFGKVATLVCYDGFREPHTRNERFVVMAQRLLERKGVAIVANPAANPWPWLDKWKYADEGETQTRAEQWATEGLCGSLRTAAFARYGITAHLVGKVLDLRFDGISEIVERTQAGDIRVLARAEAHDRAGQAVAVVDA